MNAVKPYERCLIASLSEIYYNKSIELVKERSFTEARQFAQLSWQLSNSATPWVHDSDQEPPALKAQWRQHLGLLNDALSAIAVMKSQPSSLRESERYVAMLHLIITNPLSQKIAPKTQEAAKTLLATVLIHSWVTWKVDARGGANKTEKTEEEAGGIAAAIRPISDISSLAPESQRAIQVSASAFVGQRYTVDLANPLKPIYTFEQLRSSSSVVSHPHLNKAYSLPHCPLSVLGIH